ncbi:MAG: radical SAM protein [Candidatus Omnitrophica bacterium]|nr:radical SAM protein [Candidatus Omnitrophota bacterium]
MKVLFVNPSRAGQGNIPLNIPILISVLKSHGHEVRLFDFPDYEKFSYELYKKMFFKSAPLDADQVIRDRKDFYKYDFGIMVEGCDLKRTDYKADFDKLLNDFRPDLIGVSALTVDFKFSSRFLLPFKKKYNIQVIYGGCQAILLPEETLASPACDIICTGEGEKTILAMMDALEHAKPLSTVRGIWFKQDGVIIKNPGMPLEDISSLPDPDYGSFDPIHFYRPFDGEQYKMLNYELSRGCLFDCSYCVNSVFKTRFKELGVYRRVKKIPRSIEELKNLIAKYNFNFIRFWDEDFTSLNAAYIREYADAYKKEIGLPFLIYARVSTITEEKAGILKEMGCRTFAIGIESGNDFIRREVMNRRMTNEEIIEKFRIVSSLGIRVSSYNIIGLPRETRKHIFDTIELNRLVKPDSFSVSLLAPFKGTPIRKLCEEEGLDPDYDATAFIGVQFVPKGMTRKELEGLFRTFSFYVRFPKDRYDEIKEAETDDLVYKRLLEEFRTRL